MLTGRVERNPQFVGACIAAYLSQLVRSRLLYHESQGQPGFPAARKVQHAQKPGTMAASPDNQLVSSFDRVRLLLFTKSTKPIREVLACRPASTALPFQTDGCLPGDCGLPGVGSSISLPAPTGGGDVGVLGMGPPSSFALPFSAFSAAINSRCSCLLRSYSSLAACRSARLTSVTRAFRTENCV